MSKVIILIGHSGSGKDTVSKELQQYKHVEGIIPHATRPKRSGESEGNPYYFIPVTKFLQLQAADHFIETASYKTKFNGKEEIAYYGTAYDSIPKDKTSVITIGVLAGINLKQQLPNDSILIYLNVDDDERERRAKQRGSFDQIEWNNRLAQDHERFKDGLPKNIDFIVDNTGALKETLGNIINILETIEKEVTMSEADYLTLRTKYMSSDSPDKYKAIEELDREYAAANAVYRAQDDFYESKSDPVSIDD